MTVHELAGLPAPSTILVNIPRLVSDYYSLLPDLSNPGHLVSFGTSGHRGGASRNSFNEVHILSICQAICDYRSMAGIDGPLFLGMDTHALSEPAHVSAIEVFVANGVETMVAKDLGYTPTPAVSHAILKHNEGRTTGLADGVVITPSHNPPEDGGLKYNPPHGGPADTDVTKWIETRANLHLKGGRRNVERLQYEKALKSDSLHWFDYIQTYTEDLESVVDLNAIRSSGLRIGVDPMGGAGLAYWEPIRERYKLDIEVVNPQLDPTFRFMTVDRDGKIRMDCSSPYAMAGLIKLKDDFDIAIGNDSDYDRHGIVTPTGGLMNPNHFLSVAISYLFGGHRPEWSRKSAIGKTLVSSSMIDRISRSLERELNEVPVGFKWFVNGLIDGSFGFGGEESAGASFLRRNGKVWTTDKDGFILGLLAAEITATTGRDPSVHYRELESRFGSPVYERIDTPASREEKAALMRLSAEQVMASHLAGEAILQKLTKAPGNGASIGGLKVVTENGWFAARPSGTEDICKLYAESFLGHAHLKRIQAEAQEIIAAATR